MEIKKEKIKGYIAIIGSILVVAGLGSLFVNLGMEFFDSLARPSEFVPSFVIPIVWTIIYGIFAVVLCLIYSKQNFDLKTIILLAHGLKIKPCEFIDDDKFLAENLDLD